MNNEIINAFIQNTVFTNKKIDKGVWKALMKLSGEDIKVENFVKNVSYYVGENTALIQNLIPVECKAGKNIKKGPLFFMILL